MKPTDVELMTTSGKPTTVLTLLAECRRRWESGAAARERALQMEAYTYNRMSGRSLALESSVSLPMNVPPVSKNKLRSLLLTWAARTTKRRDTALAYANEATDSDLARAEVANAYLDYLRQLQDRDAVMMRAAITAGLHGMIGLYNPWDPDHGPHKEREVVMDRYGLQPLRDEAGRYVYKEVAGRGAPTLEPLTIFDFVTSGEKDVQKGKWLLVRRWLDPDEAESLLRSKAEQLSTEQGYGTVHELCVTPQTVKPRQGNGPARELVEAWEMWWRPNEMGRLAEGLFAAIVGDYVVNATPFPYEHGELPLVAFRVMDVEDDFYGATWMEDAIPQQMGLNHSLRVLAHRAEIAGQLRMMMKANIAQKWGASDDGVISCDSVDDVMNGAKAVEVPDIPVDMYQLCDRYEQGIDDTAGISGVSSSGDTAAATKNARLVAYATQVDEQKNEHTLRNLQEAELAVDKQDLELCKQFVPLQRLIRIVGEDNAVSANYFSAAEIGSVDVRLEPAPGAERTRAAGRKSAEEAMLAGSLPVDRGAEMSTTGLGGTVDDGYQRQRLQALVQQAQGGQPVQADMTINPDLAVRELRMAVDNAADPRAAMSLRSLLLEYMDLAAQGKQQQMQQPPAMGARPAAGAGQAQQQNQLPGGM